MSAYRWPCSVPGCRCTVPEGHAYDAAHCWALCRRHWPLVPRPWKRAIRRARKRLDAGDAWADFTYARAAYNRLCRRAVRYAIERALGLG